MAWHSHVATGLLGGIVALAGTAQMPASYTRTEIDAIIRETRTSLIARDSIYSRDEADARLKEVYAHVPELARKFAADEIATRIGDIADRVSGRIDAPRISIYTATDEIPTHLFFNERVISSFTTVVQTERRGVALIDFHCDVEHRNLVNGVVGVGARLWYRYSQTRQGLAAAHPVAIPGAVTGTNILNVTHHYGQLPFSAALPLESGWYQFEVRIGSHSSLAMGADGLARIHSQSGAPYNTLRVVVIEGATMVNRL